MKTLRINLIRNERVFEKTGKVVYSATLANESSVTGFMNAFSITVHGQAVKKVEQLFATESEICAYPDARAKSGYRFVSLRS